MWLPRWTTLALFAAALFAAAAVHAAGLPSAPQSLRFDSGASALDGPWQFHFGDSPAWAEPGFDDSRWEQLTADKPWGQQGHPDRAGFAWYRLHVTLAPGESPHRLAILIPAVEDAYELYWNGRLVGTYGKLPPHPLWYYDQRPHTWGLGSARPGVLALRVWKAPFSSSDTGLQGGFYAPPLLGSPQIIAAAMASLDYGWLRSHQFIFAIDSLYGLVAFIGLGMWLRDPSQRLAVWMGCFAAPKPLALFLFDLKFPVSAVIADSIWLPAFVLGDVSLWFVLLYLLDLHGDGRILRLTRILAIVEFVVAIFDVCVLWGFTLPNPLPWQIADLSLMPVLFLLELYPFCLIGIAVLRRSKLDLARWIVAVFAFFSQTLYVAGIALGQGARFTHFTFRTVIFSPLFVVLGNRITASALSNGLLLVALLYAVWRYTAESRHEQIRLEEEIRNARAVQQVLIPDTLPAISGFCIQSVYKPAEEVGGDFFQIIPLGSGGILIVIGNVSGKGIPAAMTVSLLVGTVRTLAHYTQEPGEILDAMNQRMLARSHGGFTTCLILRAEPDDKVTVANAGHLAPYLNNREVDVEHGLPLGLSAAAAYPECGFHLAEREQLTLLTDGVVEARSKSGELFGFDRTSAIATHSAESIAQEAQRFGQQDDITVLTFSRQQVAEESIARVAPPALTPSQV